MNANPDSELKLPSKLICDGSDNLCTDDGEVFAMTAPGTGSLARALVHRYNTHRELVEALDAVSRLDYLQEHNALAEKVRKALAATKERER